jgi:hypothetical protein
MTFSHSIIFRAVILHRQEDSAGSGDARLALRKFAHVLSDGLEQLLILHVPDRLVRRADCEIRQVSDELTKADVRRQLAQSFQRLQNFSARVIPWGQAWLQVYSGRCRGRGRGHPAVEGILGIQ